MPTDDGSGNKPPGGGNGDDSGGGGDSDDGKGRGIWTVVLSLAAAVVAGVALSSWLRWQEAHEAPPRRTLRDDVASLKRLVREAFAEITDYGSRLHRLEQRAASGGSGGWTTGADLAPSAAADITLVGAIEVAPALVLSQGRSAEALHAACATPDNAAGSGGPLLRGQLRSPARDGADEVAAEVLLPCSDAGSGPDAALQKVVYSLKRGGERQQTWKLLLGRGRGDDVAATLNPAAGRGLTHLIRHGCALHQRVRGSGAGVAARLSERVHAAAVHLVSGQPGFDDAGVDAAPCGGTASSLAQATVAVSAACSVGLAAVRQRRCGCGGPDLDDAPEDAAGSWRLEARLGDVVLPPPVSTSSSTLHAVATTGTINLQHAALLSWWAAQPVISGGSDGGSSRRLRALKALQEFGISLASHPLRGPSGWALALGRSHGPRLLSPPAANGAAASSRPGAEKSHTGSAGSEVLHADGGDGGGGNGAAAAAATAAGVAAASSPTASAGSAVAGGYGSERGTADSTLGSTAPGSVAGDSGVQGAGGDSGPPWIAEASLQVPLGEGLAVTPGFVAVRANGATTYALAARMQWAF